MFEYLPTHLSCQDHKKVEFNLENKFPFSNVKTDSYEKIVPLIKKRYQLRELNFSNNKDIMPYVDKMFDLFNTAYANLSSFVAITAVQKEYFKKKYISFINPEYIKFVMDKNDNMVAFSIVMPSFSRALQKANGKLFPFGFYHLLRRIILLLNLIVQIAYSGNPISLKYSMKVNLQIFYLDHI